MIRNFKQEELKTTIIKGGNWNFRNKTLDPVLSKPIGVVNIGGDDHVFKHEDIFEILELYYQADVESMIMIRDCRINTGEVKTCEKAFLDKLKDWIKRKEEDQEGGLKVMNKLNYWSEKTENEH